MGTLGELGSPKSVRLLRRTEFGGGGRANAIAKLDPKASTRSKRGVLLLVCAICPPSGGLLTRSQLLSTDLPLLAPCSFVARPSFLVVY